MSYYFFVSFDTKEACFRFLDYCNKSPNYLGIMDYHSGIGNDYYLKFDKTKIRDIGEFGRDVQMFGGRLSQS